jgi:hypothetical protein
MSRACARTISDQSSPASYCACVIEPGLDGSARPRSSRRPSVKPARASWACCPVGQQVAGAHREHLGGDGVLAARFAGAVADDVRLSPAAASHDPGSPAVFDLDGATARSTIGRRPDLPDEMGRH